MKKIIALTLMAAMAVMTVGPAMTVATNGTVETTLTRQTGTGGSTDPIRIKAKWEMKGSCFDVTGAAPNLVYTYNGCTGVGEGKDDNNASGAQFRAPNQWGTDMNYTICAVVHGPEQNITNIDRVIAEIYYPHTPMHLSGHSTDGPICSNDHDGIHNDDGFEIDNPSGGCSAMIEQNFLHKLEQPVGKNLVCNAIHGSNDTLIEWGSNENYDKLCNDIDGQLTKGYAAVYCADKHLIWEDPAGMYKVDVFAFDKSNNQTEVFTNNFDYMDTTGYQIDFNKVNYGEVKVSTRERVYGDKCYYHPSASVFSSFPTVRNTGNVRLNMKIAQDDMGLGYQTGTTDWNVEYDARVGDLEIDWEIYRPFKEKEYPGPGSGPVWCNCLARQECAELDEVLDLSEIEEMDFSIHVIEKFPGSLASYSGNMWISANQTTFGDCN